jgi:hypothetical protein
MSLTDAEYLEELRLARDKWVALVSDLLASPKPSYNIDGQEVLWGEYLDSLFGKIRSINDLIGDNTDPFEVISYYQ